MITSPSSLNTSELAIAPTSTPRAAAASRAVAVEASNQWVLGSMPWARSTPSTSRTSWGVSSITLGV